MKNFIQTVGVGEKNYSSPQAIVTYFLEDVMSTSISTVGDVFDDGWAPNQEMEG